MLVVSLSGTPQCRFGLPGRCCVHCSHVTREGAPVSGGSQKRSQNSRNDQHSSLIRGTIFSHIVVTNSWELKMKIYS